MKTKKQSEGEATDVSGGASSLANQFMDKELTDKEIDDVLANNSETDMNPRGTSLQVFGNYLGRMLR